MSLNLVMMVALGGALGAVARYGLTVGMQNWLGTGFPWGTLLVNVVGSFLLGVLAEFWANRLHLGVEGRLLWMTGFCGGLTTFSTFSLETVHLLNNGQTWPAVGNIALNLILTLGAVVAGILLARWV